MHYENKDGNMTNQPTYQSLHVSILYFNQMELGKEANVLHGVILQQELNNENGNIIRRNQTTCRVCLYSELTLDWVAPILCTEVQEE